MKKRKNYIIVSLSCILVLMAVGYAFLYQKIDIRSKSYITGNWDIRITSVTPLSNETGAVSDIAEVGSDNISATVAATFTNPGDYMNYRVVVKNFGTINALINKVNINKTSTTESNIQATTDISDDTYLKAGNEISFIVTLSYSTDITSIPDNDEASFNIVLSIKQNSGQIDDDETIPDDENLFVVNDDGVLIDYLGTSKSVILPESVNGTPIKKISSLAFHDYDILFPDIYSSIVLVKNMDLYDNIIDSFTSKYGSQYEIYKYDEYDNEIDLNNVVLESFTCTDDTDIDTCSVHSAELSIDNIDLSNSIFLEDILGYAFSGKRDDGLKSVRFSDYSNILGNIGEGAFFYNELTEVKIPEGVTSVGENAFRYGELTSITLPSTLTNISKNTFSYNNLTNVVIPNNVETIGEDAFCNNRIVTLKLGSSLVQIDEEAFEDNQINQLVIPLSVNEIGPYAFSDNQITSLVFEDSNTNPSELITIGNDAFYNNQISTIIIPASVETINYDAFGGNSFTTSLDVIIKGNNTNPITRFDSNWTYIGFPSDGNSCYTYSNNTITGYNSVCGSNITIPSTLGGNTITKIGDFAFDSKELRSVVIPNTITSIGAGAFQSNMLKSVTIPVSVTEIKSDAFKGNGLETVNIESNDTVSKKRFNDSWSSIGFPSNTIQIDTCFNVNYDSSSNAVDIVGLGTCQLNDGKLVIPSKVDNIRVKSVGFGTALDITRSRNTSEYITKLKIEGNPKINDYAFVDYGIQELTLSDSIKIIGIWAFEKNQLSTVTIPASVEEIYAYAFSHNQLTSVNIIDTNDNPSHLTYFAGFNGNSGLDYKNLHIPDTVTTIGTAAFAGAGFNSYVIPNNITELGELAFANNNFKYVNYSTDDLTSDDINHSIIVNPSVKIIGKSAFLQNKLSYVLLSKNVEKILDYAFRGEDNYNEISFVNLESGSKLSIIEDYAFYNNNISTLPSSYSLSSIGDHAFENNNIGSVDFPMSLREIGKCAFENNDINSITLNNGLKKIKYHAFIDNDLSNTDIYIPSSVTEIGQGAFRGAKKDNININDNSNFSSSNINKWLLY